MIRFCKVVLIFAFLNLNYLNQIQQVSGQCWAPWTTRNAVSVPPNADINDLVKYYQAAADFKCPNPATQEFSICVCILFV
jgi:hypothetical protein